MKTTILFIIFFIPYLIFSQSFSSQYQTERYIESNFNFDNQSIKKSDGQSYYYKYTKAIIEDCRCTVQYTEQNYVYDAYGNMERNEKIYDVMFDFGTLSSVYIEQPYGATLMIEEPFGVTFRYSVPPNNNWNYGTANSGKGIMYGAPEYLLKNMENAFKKMMEFCVD